MKPGARLHTATIMPPAEDGIAEFLRLARIEIEQPQRYAALANVLTRDEDVLTRDEDVLTRDDASARVRTKVEELLRGNPSLMVAFNGLLPPDLRIPSPVTLYTTHALAFLRRVKARFQHQRSLYESFLDLIRMLNVRENKSILEVAREIMDLFGDHVDLQEDFLDFLHPDVRSSL